ncbi:MAG: hypothetical protein L3J20_09765 [Flavobacteriaceae bacterium]|nr:hypothetical protein [Flavobacteriaceae bacterium]
MNNFKTISFLIFTISFLFFFGCNTNSEKQSEINKKAISENVNKTEQTKIYRLKKETPYIKWTAYKFTNKTGVSGVFDKANYVSTIKKGTVKQLLKNTSFTIETKSVNSNLEIRDKKIYTYLFSKIGAEIITGEFLEVGEKGGKVTIMIGEKSQVVPFTYTISNGKIKINTRINLMRWNASSGIIALNKVCKAVHTGEDGVSKLWNEVDVVVEIAIESIKNK